MFSTLLRSISHAWQDARRNARLSFLTIVLTLVAFLLVDVFFFLQVLTKSTLTAVEERFDIVLYFQSDVSEENIKKAEETVRAIEGVRSVEYVSRFDALERFEQRYKENQVLVEVLQLFESNPLGGRLVVGLKHPSVFQGVKENIRASEFASLLLDSDFTNVNDILARAEAVSVKARRLIIGLLVFFAVVALIAVYSTVSIRLAIYHDDIRIMQMVGATSRFIHLPFFVLSLGYVLAALLVDLGLLGFAAVTIGVPATAFFDGLPVNPVTAFVSQLLVVIAWKVGVGIFLIGASTALVVRKYTRTLR